MAEYDDEYSELKIDDLARMFIDVRGQLDDAKKVVAAIQNRFDHLRKHVIPERMEDLGATSLNLTGIGRLGVTTDMYAGFQQGENAHAIKWLKENGYGDLAKETVHNSTLKAFIKEQIGKGVVLPSDLFKIDPYMRASITKAPK